MAQRASRLHYHISSSTASFSNWHLDRVLNPNIKKRIVDLYTDREQTIRQHSTFQAAKASATLIVHYHGTDMVIDVPMTDAEILYTRILCLYDTRLKYIQQQGMRRLSTWADWWHEKQKPAPHCNEDVINACKSTLEFLEDDYVKRKVEFVTEIYTLLEVKDAGRAELVLRDLGDLFPWLKRDFITKPRDYTLVFDRLKQVKGENDWGWGWR